MIVKAEIKPDVTAGGAAAVLLGGITLDGGAVVVDGGGGGGGAEVVGSEGTLVLSVVELRVCVFGGFRVKLSPGWRVMKEIGGPKLNGISPATSAISCTAALPSPNLVD